MDIERCAIAYQIDATINIIAEKEINGSKKEKDIEGNEQNAY